MKNFTFAFLAIFIMSFANCQAQTTKEGIMKDFLSGILNLEEQALNAQQPIITINELAKKKADKIIALSKDNVEAALKEAKSYKNCILTVGKHTIVKITDFENCSPSGAWGTCMPFGEGFIQKGELIPQKDYIKNIIGRPDTQIRTLYLFNS